MGGYGSGPYGNGSKIPKDTVEKAFSLEVNSIKNCLANIDSSYIHTWERTNVLGITRVVQIRIVVKEGYIILDYYDGLNEHYRYPVFITWTKCNYGGKRPWFKCPKCYKRVGKLYSKDGYYRCRVCQNLNYRSSQTTDREQAMLHWLLEGKSYRWIAELFNTSHVTVCGIKKRIVRKMLKG